MNWTSLATSAVGAFLGFASGLALFWIKESIGTKKKKKDAVKNLRYELEYNLNLYTEFKKKISEAIELINSDSRSIYLTLDYDFIGTYFAKQFYNGGYLTEFLHQEDMKRWNIFLSKLSPGGETLVTELVEGWREEKSDKEDVVRNLKHERDHIQYAFEMTEYLLDRIKL